MHIYIIKANLDTFCNKKEKKKKKIVKTKTKLRDVFTFFKLFVLDKTIYDLYPNGYFVILM